MYNTNQQHSILKGYNMLLYFAGSMIMKEPSQECITDFWAKGILKNLPVKSSNQNFIMAASFLRNSCNDKTTCVKTLCEDYNRLFSLEKSHLAPPFESFYQHDILTDSCKKQSSVTEFFNSYGWESQYKGKIPDDHLGIELLFLTILIDKYLGLDDEACIGEMRNEIRRFSEEHLNPWINEWNKKVQIHSETSCYKGIATLILACIEDVYNLFKEPQSNYS